MSRRVGIVISGGNNHTLNFVVADDEYVQVNRYYFIKHPIAGCDVLITTFSIQPYNPEMMLGRPGILTVQRGASAHPGRYLESQIVSASILGYFDHQKQWRNLEVSPHPGSEIYEPSDEELLEFFNHGFEDRDSLWVEVGKVQGCTIPVHMDLNIIAKSHLLVAGMTRAGKSSFIVNLIVKAHRLQPRPHMVIFDRRHEYAFLTRYEGVKLIPYDSFLLGGYSSRVAAKKLGLTAKDAEIFIRAYIRTHQTPPIKSILLENIREEAELRYKRKTEECVQYLSRLIDNRGEFLFQHRDACDIVKEISENPTLIIDFSKDWNAEAQHRAAASILRRITRHAMNNQGGFSVIICVEEAQYYAPEKGIEIAESDTQAEAKAQFIETISQAGGYNVGVIVITQRPAYVSKGVISQCNSIACFRLRSGNDQAAMLEYTEYGDEKLRNLLPSLADHEALVWGLAFKTPFPIVANICVEEYPRKSINSAKEAWRMMETQATIPATKPESTYQAYSKLMEIKIKEHPRISPDF